MGVPATAEEIAELNRLRTALSPEGSFKVVDDFARWLVASAAVLGSLGAGFGVSGFGDLHGFAKWLFLTAVFLMAVSLALAVISIAPRSIDFNPNSIESMENAIKDLVNRRARYLKIASVAFAGALVLAGIAPFVSSEQGEAAGMRLSLSEGGAIAARLVIDDAEPGSIVRGRFESAQIPRGVFLARTRTIANGDGRATLSVGFTRTRGFQRIRFLARWQREGETGFTVNRWTIAVPHRNIRETAAPQQHQPSKSPAP